MKTSIKWNGAIFIGAMFLTGCATLFTGSTTPVVLIDQPRDLRVKNADGDVLTTERVMADGTAGYNSTTQYFASGVMVDKQVKSHTLTLESSEGTATTNILLKPSNLMILLNVASSGIVGIGVDAYTKKWRVADNKYVDVPALLNGTEPRSQNELKKYLRESAE